MNNYFILISLILAISSSVNCVELRRICADDVFSYKDYEINSVYITKLNVSLREVAYFAIDETEEFESFEFFNNTLRDEMLSVKKEHNRRLVKLYSEHYLNQNENILDDLNEMRNDTTKLESKVFGLYLWTNKTFIENKVLSTRDEISKLTDLIDYFLSFFDNKLPQKDNEISNQIGKKELNLKLKSIIENLNLTDNQTYAFIDDTLYETYKKQIVSRPKFTFIRYSKLFYDFRSKGQLEFDIVLPFEHKAPNNNDNHDYTKDCLKAKDLPKFYQEKPYEF